MYIDQSVYPDTAPPEKLVTFAEKADYLRRICAAFDYGIVPELETIKVLAEWKDIFDQFVLSGSHGYHALRTYYGWEDLPRAEFFSSPTYKKLDKIEDREDGCEHLV